MDKLKAYRMIVDLWRFWGKYMASPPKSEEEWDALWDEMNKLWSRYDKARFYGNMLLEVVRFLDEHDAGRKK